MQYGWVLDRLIIQVVISDPELGPVCILKADISNSFYRTRLQLTDTHKLVFFSPPRCKRRGAGGNNTHPTHGVEELPTYILHGYTLRYNQKYRKKKPP